ncbi:MAG: DUF58 domain-containing protein [Betaproteobacteria bacterium]|nr:DUF58 domain-containing protein [Betaproteobacteria bacterium]MDH3437357.1 DUF58 domain-containing protein [Betaproteobacteria bacterium]
MKLVRSAGKAASTAPVAPTAESVLRRIEWTVLRRLDGLLHGNYRTLFRGFGIDLADLREYQVNDDARTIDWNATARLQVPHVRQFNEDREVTAWFLVDLSGSVNFGAGATTKRAMAVDFVALVARLLTRHGNRVGAVLYTDRVDLVLPARGGRQHVLHLLDRMLKTGNAPRPGKCTQLGELLGRALQAIKRRSVVFVVSDFISDPGWARALSLLGRCHEILAVRLYDALEMELPDLGQVIVEDAETGQQLFVDTHDAAFRGRFSFLAGERETTLRAALADAGADCIELSTEDDLVDTLMRFTRLRKRRAQLASGGVPPALVR